LLPFAITMFVYWLFRKKRVTPVQLIAGIILFGVFCSYTGIVG